MPSFHGRFSVDFTTNIAEFDFRYTQVPPLAVSRLGFQPVQKTPTIQISSGFIRGNPGLIARCSMNSNWAPLFVALLFLTTQIGAQEQAVLGQGNVSCGSWLNDRKVDDAQASSKIAWVLGYVTAFNQYESSQ